MGWSVIFTLLFILPSVLCYLCPVCDEDLCHNVDVGSCAGGLVMDNCDCCLVCARTLNQTCGGEYGLSGKCDKGLICAYSPQHGAQLSHGLIGICIECEESFEGCTVVDSLCVCDKSCVDIFEFVDEQSCQNSLKETVNNTNLHSNCSHVQCEVMFMPQCPPDSTPVKTESDTCCPQPPICQCQMDLCTRHTCAPGSDLTLIKGGLGTPGQCCDEFECTPSDNDCRDVHCPLDELGDVDCPTDSYRLPSLVTSDGCCLVHQGCECLPDSCQTIDCPSNMHKRVVTPALGHPGFCCSKYECVNVSTMSCNHEGIEFQHEETWKLDQCTTCTCRGGLMFCKVALCENQPRCDWMGTPDGECCSVCLGCMSTYGQLYANNETWFEDDYCTSCRCDNGQLHCIASSCMINCRNPRKIPGQCCPVCDEPDMVTLPPQCPSLNNCSLDCEEGLLLDRNQCPQCQCKPVECNLQCPNGYMSDDDGQEICMCAPDSNICTSIDECFKQCPYGLRRAKNGCLRCKCNKCPPFTCKKKCVGPYARNDEGCKLCRCADQDNRNVTTTTTTNIVPVITSNRACMSSDGRHFDDGESWSDGCRTCFCQSSREMCVLLNCPTVRCHTPVVLPGDCCPSCPDKSRPTVDIGTASCQSVDGVYRVEGETWNMDICTQCICHYGNVFCDSEMCPPVLCSHPVKHADKCCPHCPGDTSEVLDPSVVKTSCISSNQTVFTHGDIWRVNPCQSCMCQYGQITCYSQTCPVLECQVDRTVLKKGQCCPVCIAAKQDDICSMNDIIYSINEIWQADQCRQCTCNHGGYITCSPLMCPRLNCVQSQVPSGQCCPVCSGTSNSADTNIPGFTDSVTISLFVVAGVAVIFAVIIIILVIVIFRRRYKRRYRPQSANIATLVTETKRPKSTNLDLQGIMPLLVDNTTTNKNMSNNVYDGTTGEKRWSSEVDKNNSDNLEKTKDELVKEPLYEEKITLYKHI